MTDVSPALLKTLKYLHNAMAMGVAKVSLTGENRAANI